MEVKNQMMDQLLLNTQTQGPAISTGKAAKDADSPDFDSMVHQRRAVDKNETKDVKQQAKAEKPAKNGQQNEEGTEELTTDAQYAIAPALFQLQPDLRVEMVQTEETPLMKQLPEVETPPEIPEIPLEREEAPVEAGEEWHVATREEMMAAVSQPTERRDPEKVEDLPERPEIGKRPVVQAEQPKAEEKKEEPEETADTPETVPTDTRDAQRSKIDRVIHKFEQQPLRPEEDAETAPTQAENAMPLFERFDARPVKVGEVSKPIPLGTSEGMDKLRDMIGDAVVNQTGNDRIELTLTPAALGKLTVEITRTEHGTVSIVLRPTTERAANLLERSTNDLQRALTTSAKSEVTVQVRADEGDSRNFLDPNGHNQQQQQQQQQQREERHARQNAQEFVQQLRLGLLDEEAKDEE